MSFTKMPHSKISLKLYSKPSWPGFLGLPTWQNILLFEKQYATDADHANLAFVDLSAHEITNVLMQIYPQMSLTDLALLKEFALAQGWVLDWFQLVSFYGLRDHSHLDVTLSALLSIDQELQMWCHSKGVSVGDLAPLRALKHQSDFTLLNPIFKQLAQFQFTRSEGVRALEWIVDLYLGGKLAADFGLKLATQKSGSSWLRELEAMRYPQATQQKKSQEQVVKSLPWPKKSEVRLVRKGDTSGVEIKMFVGSTADIRTQVESLTAVAHELETRNLKSL